METAMMPPTQVISRTAVILFTAIDKNITQTTFSTNSRSTPVSTQGKLTAHSVIQVASGLVYISDKSSYNKNN